MDNKQNKYISVSYQLYSIDEDGSKHLEEQTQAGNPFTFISGFGFSLDAFEQRLLTMQPGEKFDFTLTPADAFGEYFDEGVHKMKREMFTINGHFDHENVFTGAVLPLQNEEGQRFYGKVLEIADDHVKIDLNHPLAGKDLNFKGHVVENREATNDEIQSLLNHMSGGGCGCGCHDCGDDCGDGCGDGCGHCH